MRKFTVCQRLRGAPLNPGMSWKVFELAATREVFAFQLEHAYRFDSSTLEGFLAVEDAIGSTAQGVCDRANASYQGGRSDTAFTCRFRWTPHERR